MRLSAVGAADRGGRLVARPSWPVSALADRLADAQHRLDELELDDVGVRTSVTVSYGQLRVSARAEDRWRKAGFEFTGQQAALAWLDATRANLLAAVRQAATTQGVPPEITLPLVQALFAFFAVRGHWGDWVQANQIALGVAQRVGDRAAQAQAHNDLGVAHLRSGRYGQALAEHQRSLAIRRELGDRRGQAASLNNLGLVHVQLERYEEALACQRESLAICRELGDHSGQAHSLRELGVTLRALGRPEEARAHWLDARTILQQLQTSEADQVRVLLADLPSEPAGRESPASRPESATKTSCVAGPGFEAG